MTDEVAVRLPAKPGGESPRLSVRRWPKDPKLMQGGRPWVGMIDDGDSCLYWRVSATWGEAMAIGCVALEIVRSSEAKT